MSDAKLGTWTAPESPVTVEYSLVVVDEIRRAVTEGFQKLSRGGIEVGGILYGVRDGETVRLLATQTIVCEHARGPAFALSENDRAALSAQLKEGTTDPHLSGFVPVGWFVSHTRSGILLSDTDLEVYNSFFTEPWQLTLVVRPGRGLSMRAGFFVREFDGALRTESSYLEFSFPDRLTSMLERPPRTGPPERRGPPPPRGGPDRELPDRGLDRGSERGPDRGMDTSSSAVPVMREYAASGPESETAPQFAPRLDVPSWTATPPPKKKWAWLAVWALVLAGLVSVGFRYLRPQTPAEPIGLVLAERDGMLQVEWSHTAAPVLAAVRGSLEITDGKQARSVALTTADLARGNFAYQRSTGDIEVRLNVEASNGSKVQEVSRFLGSGPAPAAKTDDVQDLEKRRDELQQEVDSLKEQNAQQTARIQQLERTLRILQTRLGQK